MMCFLQFPVTPWLCLRWKNSFGLLVLWYWRSVILWSPHPTNQEQEHRPFANQHPVILYLILWDLWDTDVCFLHLQLTGTNVRLPKIQKIFPEVDFESSNVSSNIWVLKKTWSAMLSCITHMTILSTVVCVMNVWNQTSQAFVTSSCPLRACSSKLVYRPKNVKSTNSCQVQAFQDNLRTYIR